ncbi:hypothetical protein HPB50_027906 [Hyalomma asiaticum]|nr:hypothetical protein HPB50_027906 [Hyalomma asiaticum]
MQVEEPLHTERKFIVFESCLRELLSKCKVCGLPVENLSLSITGTLLAVEGVCKKEHRLQWRSQPLIQGSGDGAGNFLWAAGMLYSGCMVAAIRCLNSIGVQTITERTFYNYHRASLLPAIDKLYLQRQAEMVKDLADSQIDLAGDGRCDSPGYSTKYMTYSVLAMQNGCILHTEQVQVGESPEVPNSVSMEKEGLAKCLTAVEELGVNIRSLTTDRHPGVKRYCREHKPDMKHWFDVWHVAKGLKKKLFAASRKHKVLSVWTQGIINHLYWVAAMGQGDGELVSSMWRRLLRHVCNRHDGHDGPYTKCLHDQLEDREWITPSSPAFHQLKAIVDNPLLLRDIPRLSPEHGMQARTRLAVLHFNENVGRHQALTQEGEARWKIKSSKARRGHFTVATVKEDPSYGYVDQLLRDALELCQNSSYKESFAGTKAAPAHHMSLAYERPSKQDLIERRRTRFAAVSTLSAARRSCAVVLK